MNILLGFCLGAYVVGGIFVFFRASDELAFDSSPEHVKTWLSIGAALAWPIGLFIGLVAHLWSRR